MPGNPIIPPPDTIDPHGPAETPPAAWPPEGPGPSGPEYEPCPPDTYTPDTGPAEIPTPGD